jgi:hypothetical protein
MMWLILIGVLCMSAPALIRLLGPSRFCTDHILINHRITTRVIVAKGALFIVLFCIYNLLSD